MQAIRVLLVDDHQIVREGYQRLFERADDITLAGEADSGDAAIAAYAELRPDVVVMDIGMPGMDGLAAAAHIMADDEQARILMLSVRENSEYAARALAGGAMGFVSKRSSARELIEAVRVVARGRIYITEELRAAVLRTQMHQYDPVGELSPRQREVLTLVAAGKSVEEIASQLRISPKTAGHHFTALKQALGLNTRAALALVAVRAGLVEL